MSSLTCKNITKYNKITEITISAMISERSEGGGGKDSRSQNRKQNQWRKSQKEWIDQIN